MANDKPKNEGKKTMSGAMAAEKSITHTEKSTTGAEKATTGAEKSSNALLVLEKSTKDAEKSTKGEIEAGKSTAAMKGKNAASSTWAALFNDNRKLENGLKLKEWKVGEREIEEKDLTNIEDSWGICLVGYILGRFPGRKAVDEVRNGWGIKHHFYIHPSGWMVFKFGCQEDRELVLSKGPYNTFGTPWLLKSLPPLFKFDDECLNFIPTWIQLPSLPLECWNDIVLGKIVSNVGKPISTDQCTALRSRPGFARVLVEVDTKEPLVNEVVFKLPNGGEICQKVIYENPPVMCESCNRMGHSKAACKRSDIQGRGRSLSRGRRGGSKVQIAEKKEYKNPAHKAVNQRPQQCVYVAKKIGDAPNISKAVVEDLKGGDNIILKEKMAKDGVQPCVIQPEEKMAQGRRGRPVTGRRSPTEMEEKEISQGDEEKNKGKMIVELQEGKAPAKVCQASSSNDVGETSVVRERPVVADDISVHKGAVIVGKEEKESTSLASTSTSQKSTFFDMDSVEEVTELAEIMGLEVVSKKRDKKKSKGKNRGRLRQK